MLNDWIQNYYFLGSSLGSMAIAQGTKIAILIFKKEPFSLKKWMTAGGMPSSHSALVAGMTTAFILNYGLYSEWVALSIPFSLIVIYDAAGIRRAVGYHAIYLNKVNKTLPEPKLDTTFAESLGHSPLEIAVGIVVGIVTAITLYYA